MQMPQLVGIAHHVDRGDPAILDVECRRLQFAISLQCHETRQAACTLTSAASIAPSANMSPLRDAV